jgi:hypothetical protein
VSQRKYQDLTPDAQRIYSGVLRAIGRVNARRKSLLSVGRSTARYPKEERDRAYDQAHKLEAAKASLLAVRDELLGRVPTWDETGVIPVRTPDGVQRSYRVADVDLDELMKLELFHGWVCVRMWSRGHVDLPEFPSDSTALAVTLVALQTDAEHARAAGDRRDRSLKPREDAQAHWKDHNPSPERAP